jgi:hypothetical protein
MKRKLFVLVLAASAVLTGAPAVAGEIYKYVDDEGNVNFVDRPTGQTGEQRMELTYARTSGAAITAQVERRQQYMDAREKAREEEMTQREAEEQLRAEAIVRKNECKQHRARLESYLQARRMYRENDAGEREYLDDSEMQVARQQVEEKIAETCS